MRTYALDAGPLTLTAGVRRTELAPVLRGLVLVMVLVATFVFAMRLRGRGVPSPGSGFPPHRPDTGRSAGETV
ncbi:DUF6479 family protein [Streptomyces sp. NPDC056049]|uniref:DUF6479 family protein n=1 Tax=Streptomyces sp. NPDC056049 TaxID=3345693 RepID=UPI0035E146FA